MFDTVFAILRSDLQPWFKQNLRTERYYQELLNDTEEVACVQPMFRMEMHGVVYVPAMALYYQRIIDNELHGWLNEQWAEKRLGQTDNQVLYRQSVYTNVFDELLTHTDALIGQYGYSMENVCGRTVNYQTDLQPKVCTIICYYIQAALIRTYLTWQEYYKSSLVGHTIYESAEEMAFQYLKHALPIQISITDMEAMTEAELEEDGTKVTTKAQRFIDTVTKYQFLAMPKVAKLKSDRQILMIEKMAEDATFAAALLDQLGYHKRLLDEYGISKEDMYKHCGKALSTSNSTYKKYYLSLRNPEKETYSKHNAAKHVEAAAEYYNNLLK